ncbi:MAG TPA: hypothetical protein VGI73_04425 [Solirubrobacterales bacterium]
MRPTCLITIGPQEGVRELILIDEGKTKSRSIRIRFNLTGLTCTQPASCGGTPGTFSDGSLSGESRLTGKTAKEVEEGIWVD